MPSPETFQKMFTLSAEHQSSITHHEGALSYRAGIVKGKKMLIVFTQGRLPKEKQLEEIAEDAGFFDLRITPHTVKESKKAILIHEGLQIPPCQHQFAMPVHFDSRLTYGMTQTCSICNVTMSYEGRRRGKQVKFIYDDLWELREHIWKAWGLFGPRPDSLTPQKWHKEA